MALLESTWLCITLPWLYLTLHYYGFLLMLKFVLYNCLQLLTFMFVFFLGWFVCLFFCCLFVCYILVCMYVIYSIDKHSWKTSYLVVLEIIRVTCMEWIIDSADCVHAVLISPLARYSSAYVLRSGWLCVTSRPIWCDSLIVYPFNCAVLYPTIQCKPRTMQPACYAKSLHTH